MGITRETEALRGVAELAESAGWYLPHQNICWISERHNLLVRDEDGRLHNVGGPAVMYPDGWSIYAWHGVRVPGFVIEQPEQITVAQIMAEENQEVRRVMIERMGWERFCEGAQMSVIHADELHTNFPALPISELVSPGERLVTSYRSGTEKAELLEAQGLLDFEDRPLRFVRVTDPSTGRRYTIRVKYNHSRCYEAIGASFGMTEYQYKRSIYLRQGDVFLSPLATKLDKQQHS